MTDWIVNTHCRLWSGDKQLNLIGISHIYLNMKDRDKPDACEVELVTNCKQGLEFLYNFPYGCTLEVREHSGEKISLSDSKTIITLMNCYPQSATINRMVLAECEPDALYMHGFDARSPDDWQVVEYSLLLKCKLRIDWLIE